MNAVRVALRHLVAVDLRLAGAAAATEPVTFAIRIGGLPVLHREVSPLEWPLIRGARVFSGYRRVVLDATERADGSVAASFGIVSRIADLPVHAHPDHLLPWSLRIFDGAQEYGTCVLVLAELLRTRRARVAPGDLGAEAYHILAGLMAGEPLSAEAVAVEALLAGLDG